MDHFIHFAVCVCVWNHLRRRRPFFSFLDGRTFGFTSSDETLQTGGVDICQYPHLQHVNNIFVFSLRKKPERKKKITNEESHTLLPWPHNDIDYN